MGRKIDMKKIQDVTKCQVTFSKRRSSLIKKANEISVCCDVDVAFVAFSPSGRVSKFCNQRRIEDVLHRYVNLPAERRLTHITNVQKKMEKLRYLEHIKGDASKLQFLEKQIENLDLQITKSGLELQILEADLRDYELGPEQEPSLHQLCWCERNLSQSLERVIAWKNALSCNGSTSYDQIPIVQMEQQELGNPFSYNFSENELVSVQENPNSTGQILLQLDPWISPYSGRVRESIFKDLLLDQSDNTMPKINQGSSSNMASTYPIQDSLSIFESNSGIFSTSDAPIPAPQINPHQQSLVVDQMLLHFSDQNNVNYSDTLGHTQPPRFTSSKTVATNASINIVESPRLWSQMSTMQGDEFVGARADYSNTHIISDENYSCRLNRAYGITKCTDQSEDPCDQVHPVEGNMGDSSSGTTKIQKSGLWEWEDLLLEDNINFGDFTK